MTAKIKLNAASGGGSVSIQAPSTTSNTRVITLPDRNQVGLGTILQVVSATKTDTQSINANTTADITGLSVSITPSSTSSKILISYSITAGNTEGGYSGGILLLRDSTQIYLGDAASSRARLANYISISNTGGGTDYNMVNASGEHLDSPSSTSAITYKLQAKNLASSTGVLYIGRSKNDQDQSYIARTPSSITVMEVAA